MRMTYWSETGNVAGLRNHVNDPSFGSLGESTLNVPFGPPVEYSILTLPVNPSGAPADVVRRLLREPFTAVGVGDEDVLLHAADASGVLPYPRD